MIWIGILIGIAVALGLAILLKWFFDLPEACDGPDLVDDKDPDEGDRE